MTHQHKQELLSLLEYCCIVATPASHRNLQINVLIVLFGLFWGLETLWFL